MEISPEYSLEGLMLELKVNTLATWCKELIHWKRPWCWERLKAGGEGDSRGWDGWMVLPTLWTWLWTSSRNWWWTGRPDVLRFMGSQRVEHYWETDLIWSGKRNMLCTHIHTMLPTILFLVNISLLLLMLSNCGAGEESWESLGQEGDQTSPS